MGVLNKLKKIGIVLAGIFVIGETASAVATSNVKDDLEEKGYTNITFSSSNDAPQLESNKIKDTWKTCVTATNKDGKSVKGVVSFDMFPYKTRGIDFQ